MDMECVDVSFFLRATLLDTNLHRTAWRDSLIVAVLA